MNQVPDARATKRVIRKRRAIAAAAVGSLALAGVAVLPFTGALAAVNEINGNVKTTATGNANIDGAVATSYRVTGTGGTVVTSSPATAGGTGNFAIPQGAAADGGTYKVRITAPGHITGWYTGTPSGAATYTAGAVASSYAAGTTVNYTAAAPGTDLGNIQLSPAGAVDPTISVTSVTPLDASGSPIVGQSNPYPGQRIRVALSVTATGFTPSGFVQLNGGTLLEAGAITGTQIAALSNGTATIDTVAAGGATATGNVDVHYSGDANVASDTETEGNLVIAGGGGTITGTIDAGTDDSGVTVQVWNAPAAPAVPTPAVITTTDANGMYRATVANGNYKIKFVKAGLVSEWNGDVLSYTAAGNVTVNSDSQAVNQTLAAQGAGTFAPTTIAVSPPSPKVGEAVTFTITAATGTTGAIGFDGGTPDQEQVLAGGPPPTVALTKTFTSSGAQNVVFTFGGNGTTRAGTFSQTVNIGGGAVLSGTLTTGVANTPINGGSVQVYNASSGAAVGAALTTDANGKYSVGLVPGSYKVGFSNGLTHVPEFSGDKATLGSADIITIGDSAVTSDANLQAVGGGGATVAWTATPASPIVNEPFDVTVTVTGTGVTGTVLPVGFPETQRKVLDASGKATFSLSYDSTGNKDLDFRYSGSATLNTAVSAQADIAVGAASTTSLSVSPSTVKSGATTVLTAIVRDRAAGTAINAVGTVTFKNGSTVIGVPQAVNASGIASVTTTTLPVGANQLTAEYSGGTGFGGSTSQPQLLTVLPAAGTFEPVDPTRVLQPTAVGAGATTTVTLTDIPANAKAVKLNVTVSGVNQTTYVSACAGGTSADDCKKTSVINSSGDDLRNFVIVPLGGTGTNQVTLYNNAGTVNLSADLMGWVVDSASTNGGVFATYAPTRLTEDARVLGNRGWTTVTIDDVPAGATAVAVNVTVAGVTSNTYISGCAWGTASDDCMASSIINSNKQDRANMAIIPLGGTLKNKIRLYNNAGTSQVFLDLQGYVLGAAGTGSDGRYQTVSPTRVLEPTSIGQEQFTTVKLQNVPAGATAVALNLTAAGVKANTYFSACPSSLADATCKSTSVLNSKGPDTAGFVIVKLGGANNDEVKIYNNRGSNLILADLQGWVIG